MRLLSLAEGVLAVCVFNCHAADRAPLEPANLTCPGFAFDRIDARKDRFGKPLIRFFSFEEDTTGAKMVRTLDSEFSFSAIACDTNAFAFTTWEESTVYLETVLLSPEVRRDTLCFGSFDGWLSQISRCAILSRYSLLAGPTSSDLADHSIEIRRMESKNLVVKLRHLEPVGAVAASLDYSQFLITALDTIHHYPQRDWLIVYDAPGDSLWELRSNTQIARPGRRNRTGPIYYLKLTSDRGGVNSNLFRWTESGGETNLTNLKFPMCVVSYSLACNFIEVYLENLNDRSQQKVKTGPMRRILRE